MPQAILLIMATPKKFQGDIMHHPALKGYLGN
jgi:hypothetical protein